MKFPTVILYDREGYELAREDEVEGMKRAEARALYLLSDRYAQACETTHADMKTMKAAVFDEGEPTGAHRLCNWDKFHPQHGAWEKSEKEKAEKETP